MKSHKIGMEALSSAARAAGFVMVHEEVETESVGPSAPALPAPVVSSPAPDTLQARSAELRATAASVTTWIRDRVPSFGRGAPA